MRYIVSAAVLALTSHVAMASSIEVIDHDRTENNSIVTIGCAACPPLKEKSERNAYVAPVLGPEVQKTEIRDVDGSKEMVRTEALLGGSPVVYISTAKTWLPQDTGTALAAAPDTTTQTHDGVDYSATTAAVTPPLQQTEPVRASVATAPPDFSNFSLRINN